MGFQPRHFQITIYKEPFRPDRTFGRCRKASIGVFRLSTWHVVAQVHNAYGTKQITALRAGRLDVAFAFSAPKRDSELDHLAVALHHVELAIPKGHPLAKLKKLGLRDLVDASFVWFPRREAPAFTAEPGSRFNLVRFDYWRGAHLRSGRHRFYQAPALPAVPLA